MTKKRIKPLAKLPCPTEGCTNKVIKSGYCSPCRVRKHRAADLEKYVYDNLRFNAKRRGHSCTITLEEFREFIRTTPYMEGRGTGADDLTLDRIKDELGYAKGNIQILKNTENIKKKYAYYGQTEPEQPKEVMPVTGSPVIHSSLTPDF